MLAICGLAFAAAAAPAAPKAPPDTVAIAAAADLHDALDALLAVFHQTHPEITTTTSFGSSGLLYTQITQKAPFDVFLAADATYPQALIGSGLAEPGSQFIYAEGSLVLWARRALGLPISRQSVAATLASPAVAKIAIANPEHAPYGRAATEALANLQLLVPNKAKLVRGENVAQAAEFAASGAADVAIIARPLALAPAMLQLGDYTDIPKSSYTSLLQTGVILRVAKFPAAAAALCSFITGAQGQRILSEHGYGAAPKADAAAPKSLP